MTARIFVKLILAVTGVLAVALTSVSLIATPRVRDSFLNSLERELTEKAHALALALPRDPSEFARMGQAAGSRLTWVDPDGKVLADSEADPTTMDNHANRPEIVLARAGKIGFVTRTSSTFGTEFSYLAIPVNVPAPGSALRLAVSADQVDARVRELRNSVLLATTLAFVPAVLLAAWFARRASASLGRIIDYTRTLTQGNFRTRLEGSGRGEFGLLSANLNETSEKLQFMMERLDAEHAELEKVERVRKDFVINVSHELRTPLASILGYTDTLLDGALNEPQNAVKFLNIIRQNTERLTRLTADLLVLSRIELGQQRFKFASYSVNRLVNDDVDAMQPLAARKGIVLNVELATESLEVFADAEAVHQILTNLLENAIKYTPDGGVVTVGANPSGASHIEFFVRDSGMGIPPEDLARLFERFYRVDKARSRALGGTGLGLAIVKHLTRAQGGEVRVESRVDKGSTFYFTLPVNDLGIDELGAVQQELTVQ
jgi:two-component system, OmpR family, phosphate regulon sensor histidine kinase PhoR